MNTNSINGNAMIIQNIMTIMIKDKLLHTLVTF